MVVISACAYNSSQQGSMCLTASVRLITRACVHAHTSFITQALNVEGTKKSCA